MTPSLSPLQRDLSATAVVLFYVIGLVAICDALVQRAWISSSLSRKVVHIGAASWLLFWPLYSSREDGPYWRLNVFVPVAKGLELFVKGAIVRDPNDKDVRSMSRSGHPSELLLGPFQFTGVMTIVGLFFFRQNVGFLIMAAVGVGDGVAPIVGRRFGRNKYRSPLVPKNADVKSFEGSVGVCVGTLLGYHVFAMVVIPSEPLIPVSTVCRYALATAVVEGLSPSNIDNIAIPVAIYCLYRFQVL